MQDIVKDMLLMTALHCDDHAFSTLQRCMLILSGNSSDHLRQQLPRSAMDTEISMPEVWR